MSRLCWFWFSWWYHSLYPLHLLCSLSVVLLVTETSSWIHLFLRHPLLSEKFQDQLKHIWLRIRGSSLNWKLMEHFNLLQLLILRVYPSHYSRNDWICNIQIENSFFRCIEVFCRSAIKWQHDIVLACMFALSELSCGKIQRELFCRGNIQRKFLLVGERCCGVGVCLSDCWTLFRASSNKLPVSGPPNPNPYIAAVLSLDVLTMTAAALCIKWTKVGVRGIDFNTCKVRYEYQDDIHTLTRLILLAEWKNPDWNSLDRLAGRHVLNLTLPGYVYAD